MSHAIARIVPYVLVCVVGVTGAVMDGHALGRTFWFGFATFFLGRLAEFISVLP